MRHLLKFIRNEKYLFVISAVIFLAFFGAGMISSIFFPLKENSEISPADPFKEVYENPHIVQNPIYILKHNTLGLLTGFSGIFTFGTTTFFFLTYNGVLLGLVIGGLWRSQIPLSRTLLLILPHGIFEIPAIWITGVVGFKIPKETIKYLRGKKEYIIDKKEVYNLAIVCAETWILIVVAAIIEALTGKFVLGGE